MRRSRKEFSAVDLLETGTDRVPLPLPYRLGSFQLVVYLQSLRPDASHPVQPLVTLADLLAGKGCCIIGGRAGELS